MLFIIIGIILIIIGTIFAVLIKNGKIFSEGCFVLMVTFYVTGLFIFLICSPMIISANSFRTKQQIRTKLDNEIAEIESDKLLITSIKDDYARSMAIIKYNEKVKAFKTEVEHGKTALKSLWIGWFNNSIYNEYDSSVVEYIIEIK